MYQVVEYAGLARRNVQEGQEKPASAPKKLQSRESFEFMARM